VALQKPDADLIGGICNNLTTGMLPHDAAALAGVNRDTFAEWMRRADAGEEPFAGAQAEFERAELTAQRRLLTSLSVAAASDPKYAAWLLIHRWRKGWRDGVTAEVSASQISAPSINKAKIASSIEASFPLLSWERPEQFHDIVVALLDEHLPVGPTEEHFVEELAGVLLRKQRVRLAETASHRAGMKDAVGPFSGTAKEALAHLGDEAPADALKAALTATDEETAEDLADAEKGEAQIQRVVAILKSKRADRYRRALTALGEKEEWWEEELAESSTEATDDREALQGDEPAEPKPRRQATPESLLRYLEWEILPWYAKRLAGLRNRALLRQHAIGSSFKAEDLETLGRIDAALDRKMGQILDRLLQLQDRRRAREAG
jgi:hypothetical protein